MADDVSIDPGTTPSVPVAADDIAGVKYQRVKLRAADDGSAGADVSTANPLPTVDAAAGTTLSTVSATLTSIDAGVPAALGTNGGMKVEGVASGTPIPISGSISVTGTMPVDSSKTEDTAHVSGDVGAFMLGVRNDAGTALAGTTGDYIPLTTDSTGNLRVTGGGGGTQYAEDAAHASGDLGTMALGVRKDTATALSGTDGDYTPLITDASGRQHVNVGTSVLPTGAATETSVALSATALGAPADAAATTTGSVIAQLRRIANLVAGTLTVGGTVTTTPPSNASTNVAQVAGTTTDTNSGTKSAGTQRVVLATDQPQLTNALKVDGSAVTQPVSGTVTTTPPSNASSNVAQINGVTPLMGAGNTGTGSMRVTLATDQAQLTNPLLVSQSPATSGGYSINRVVAAASTNATSVKASAGQVFGWFISNAAAYSVFVKLYNKASSPTVGTDTPVMTLMIPGGAAANVEYIGGIAFGTGIALATTKLVADSDTTVLVANDCIVNLLYK